MGKSKLYPRGEGEYYSVCKIGSKYYVGIFQRKEVFPFSDEVQLEDNPYCYFTSLAFDDEFYAERLCDILSEEYNEGVNDTQEGHH